MTSSTLAVTSSLICIWASPFNLSLTIVLRSQVFIRRRAETDCSHSHVVTGTTARIFKVTGDPTRRFREIYHYSANFYPISLKFSPNIVR
jgi:hypothetical protein